MKLICYIQCGLGDFYDLLSMLSDFIEKRNIKKEDIKFYIDSIYFNQPQFAKQKEMIKKLVELFTKNYEVIPAAIGSWQDMFYTDKADRVTGPKYEKIKNTFLFYRRPETVNFFKERLDEDTIFLYGIMGANFTFEWKDNVNVYLKNIYKRKPLRFEIPIEIRKYFDALLKKHSSFVQIRKKGVCKTDAFFNDILASLQARNLNPLYVNLDGGTIKGGTDISSYSPESILYILEHVKYVITTSSGFSFHRVLFDKPTIITTPERLIGNKYVYQKEYIENPKYLFLNSDQNILPQIQHRISTWPN